VADLSHTPAARYADIINRVAAEMLADGRPHAIAPDRFVLLIAGVGDRETRWGAIRGKSGTTGAGIVGFDGHGRGLMQIDDRYHALARWDDPETNIRAGAAILLANLDHYGGDEPPALAAYNCGLHGVDRALSEGLGVDAYTTGRDYSRDVLARVARWTGA
jgi:hypothetical protein